MDHDGGRRRLVRAVQTPVLEIELEEGGPSDRPVLLLHGWPDAPRGWRLVGERLWERGWRTMTPALRGTGGTRFRSHETPRDGRGVALAADALELLDTFDLDRVPVVGHDWGARRVYPRRACTGSSIRDRGAGVAVSTPWRVHHPAVRAGTSLVVPVADVPRRGRPRSRNRSDRLRPHPMGHVEAAGMVRRRRVQRHRSKLHQSGLDRDHPERLSFPVPRRRAARRPIRRSKQALGADRAHQHADPHDPGRRRSLRPSLRISESGAFLCGALRANSARWHRPSPTPRST
jgi:pimeloyl-ACP methyl ester carboxylesterase